MTKNALLKRGPKNSGNAWKKTFFFQWISSLSRKELKHKSWLLLLGYFRLWSRKNLNPVFCSNVQCSNIFKMHQICTMYIILSYFDWTVPAFKFWIFFFLRLKFCPLLECGLCPAVPMIHIDFELGYVVQSMGAIFFALFYKTLFGRSLGSCLL